MPPSNSALTITHEDLLNLVAARVDEVLTEESLERLASARVDVRVGRLTLEQVMPRLGCSNIKQVRDKCRRLRIPLRKELGQKAPFVLIADLEAANQRAPRIAPVKALGSSVIERVGPPLAVSAAA